VKNGGKWLSDVTDDFSVFQVPVYRGAAKPLLMQLHTLSNYHGKDGLGDTDVDKDSPVDLSLIKEEFAAVAMVNLVNKYPGNF
jgi:inosine-uridine nucleoside N-ribohydrolase